MASVVEHGDYQVPQKRLCIFCYKGVVSEDKASESEHSENNEIGNFLKFFERFVGPLEKDIKCEKTANCLTFSKADNNLWDELGRCKDCESVLKSFCYVYHQWKSWELQLEWKVKMLVDIMKSASRVPSRVKYLQTIFQGNKDHAARVPAESTVSNVKLENFKKFRRTIIRKCDEKVSKSLPRVMLTKRKGSGSNSQVVPPFPRLKNEHFENNSTLCVNNTNVAIFLGWSLSMAAVALLAVSSTNENQTTGYNEDPYEMLTVFSPDAMSNMECNDDICMGETDMERIENESNEVIHDHATTMISRNKSEQELEVDEPTNVDITVTEDNPNLTPGDDRINPTSEINDITGHDETVFSTINTDNDFMAYHDPTDDGSDDEEENDNSKIHVEELHREKSVEEIQPEKTDMEIMSEFVMLKIIKYMQTDENVHDLNEHDCSVTHSLVNASSMNTSKVDSSTKNGPQETQILSEHTQKSKKDSQNLSATHFPCLVCSNAYTIKGSLFRHYRKRHSIRIPMAGKNNFYCKYCNVTVSRLHRHKTLKCHKIMKKQFLRKQLSLKRESNDDDVANDNCNNGTEGEKIKEPETNQSSANKNAVMTFKVNVISSSLKKEIGEENDVSSECENEINANGDSSVRTTEPASSTKMSFKPQIQVQKRYNLRGNKKQSYHNMMLDIQEEEEETNKEESFQLNNLDPNSEEDEESSSSSSDEDITTKGTSSELDGADRNSDDEDSSSATDEEDAGGIISDNPESEDEKMKIKNSLKNYVGCKLDSCNGSLVVKENYKNHQRLHAHGSYKCAFCKVVEENVIRLIDHERATHKNKSSDKNGFSCPRCPFVESKNRMRYIWHFAEVHIGGFKENRQECFICQKELVIYSNSEIETQDEHFQEYHDTTGMDPEQTHKCTYEGCTAYFKTALQLTDHLDVIHTFNSTNKSKEETSIKERKTFMCPFCKKVFKTFNSLEHHKKSLHLRSNTFVCKTGRCLYRFKTLENLKTHQKLHGTFTCNFCSVVKTFAPDLCLHEMEHAIRPEPVTDQSTVADEKFNCARCSYSIDRESRLVKHHLKSHLNLTSTFSTCPICKAEGMTVNFPQVHFKSHHKTDGLDDSQILKCNQCPAYFIRSEQLNQHIVKIHKNGGTTCPECSKTFYNNPSLKLHMERFHPICVTDLIFACTLPSCKSRFHSQHALNQHISSVHENNGDDGIFKCSKCSKEFKGETELKKHMKAVHVTASFVCSECGKAFKRMSLLTRHMIYHNPDSWKFQCSTCGKKFAFKEKLDEHVQTHSKDFKPIICQCCGQKYRQRHTWKDHMRTKHPEEFNELEYSTREKGNYLSRKGFKKGHCILGGMK